jgi:hypothetical protein
MTMPKKLLFTLFESADDGLERMAQQWGNEGRNSVLLGSGDFTLESAIDFARKVAKNWVGFDLKVTVKNNDSNTASTQNIENKNRDKDENSIMNNDILMVLRHDMGKNFSFFWARTSIHFFSLLKSRKVSIDYNSTTVSTTLEILK